MRTSGLVIAALALVATGVVAHVAGMSPAASAGEARGLDVIPAALRLAFTWSWLILAPGWLVALACGWLDGRDIHRHLALATVTGLALASLVACIAGLAGVPLAMSAPVIAVAGGGAGLYAWRRRGRARDGAQSAHGAKAGHAAVAARSGEGGDLAGMVRGAGIQAAGAALLVAISLVLFHAGSTLDYPEDSLAHVAAIRAAGEEGRALPRDVWFAAGSVPGPDPRFGLYHGVLALAGREAHLAAVDTWRLAPGVLAPAAVAAFMWLCGALWTSRAGPLVAGLVLVLLYEGGDARGLRVVSDPMGPAVFIAWTSLAIFLEGVRRNDRRLRWAGAAIGASAAFAHVWGAVQAVLSFALFAAGGFLVRRRDWAREGARAAAWSALLVAPYLVYRFATSFHPANPANWMPQGVLRLGHGLFILSPEDALKDFGVAGIVSFLALPRLVRLAPRDPGALALSAGMIFAVITLLNPAAMPLAFRALSYLALRLRYLALVPAALAWVLERSGADALDRRLAPSRRRPAAVLAVAILFMLAPAARSRAAALRPDPAGDPDDPLRCRAGLEALDREVRRPAVFASDAFSAYAIPAFTRHHVVAIPWEHASPNDPRPGDRLLAQEEILSPYTRLDETLELIRREGVSYVLLNKTHLRHHEGYGFAVLPEALPLMRAKFDAFPEIFERRLDTDDLVLYEVCDTTPPAAGTRGAAPGYAPPPPLVAPATDGADAAPLACYQGGVNLVSFRLAPATASAGDSISVECWWARSGAGTRGDMALEGARFPRAYLRLDEAGRTLGGPASKLARRIREVREHRLHRSRVRHTPGGGLVSLDELRPGERLHDVWGFRLPRALAPGRYDVRIALLPMELVPTFEWRDYVSDDDRFSGPRVASIEVGP